MQIRDNVRERRRERIQQLIGQRASEEPAKAEVNTQETSGTDRIQAGFPRFDSNPVQPKAETFRSDYSNVLPPKAETQRQSPNPAIPPLAPAADPELWWKEREKQLKSGHGGWQGVKGLSPTSSNRVDDPTRSFDFAKLIRGFIFRLVVSGLLFAAAWGWLKLELPGSGEARNWMVSSVTRDMDFQAIEAWYGETFGGTPSFLPFNRNGTDTKEVSALLTPKQTAIPVHGRLVQSFAQNRAGVKVAAKGGSDVFVMYTGRVQQVTEDQDGGMTILVQHENGILTVYGNLEKALVKPNDWVETGQQLGQLPATGGGGEEAVLYFAVQQNGKTLDPAGVVSFD
ncbi:M23 family metallopeptidase [Cohnella silvisoli]|uniref:M23 family metallopeptidase n=1 Tax=Cohnella silvisoli TaxID=2873699 RepID=A0ABV1KTY4_9BACL|nr:M23 family metallopeptidase [Cohnella silvisoli]MCD9022709.1 M23 family metallopeptidase [Cohnella silvisoli]